MTTATTTTAINHAATANFRVWVAEIITQLLAVGLTQTADTGQINTTTVNKPAINTMAGYAIFRFNDTLQASAPVFFKLEFGTGSVVNNPAVLVTIGTGSNGSGTITGNVGTRRAAFVDQAPVSTVTNYTSRFAYNATYGSFSMVWKIGSYSGTPNEAMGAVLIGRSNDSTGAATGDAVWMIANSSTTAGLAIPGYMECLSYLTSLVYPNPGGISTPNQHWAFLPFYDGNTSNLYLSNTQLGPVYYMTPVYAVSALAGAGLLADIPLGTTFSTALVGATAKTFVQVGSPFGGQPVQNQAGNGLCILWQ